MDLEIRPVTADEVPAFVRAEHVPFGIRADEGTVDDVAGLVELDRTLAVVDGSAFVATAAALSFEVTVPGPRLLPAAGITAVAVLPTHRRRGLLSLLMGRLLEDARRRGEPVAVLIASEATIYGRFGFGVATSGLAVRLDPRRARFGRVPDGRGRVRLLDPDEMAGVLPALHDRFRGIQPGEVTRPPGWWKAWLRDPEDDRDGASPHFAVVHEGDAGPDAYAAYRVKESWSPAAEPGHELRVEEVIASEPEAEAALWRYLLDVDLVRTVTAANLPPDLPLRWLLGDPRAVAVEALHDRLWVRLLDLPAALCARRYPVADALVLEVVDPTLPESSRRWRLDAGPEGAECRPTDADADLALDVADLGTCWMGGAPMSALARAGRVVEGTPGAVRRGDALFAVDRPPWCATAF